MYATQRRTDANRENAKKSTGPVTLEGKAISSLNRLSHGFASSTRFIPGENPEEFAALLNDLIREHQPATPTEQMLVEKMAHNYWIGLRASRVQGEILNKNLEFFGVPKDLALLIRYETTADRAFHKAHQELVKAQKERAKSANGFESKKAGSAPRPAAEKPSAACPNAPEIPVQPDAQPEIITVQPELMREMAAGAEKFSTAA